MTEKRHPNSEKGWQDSPFIGRPFINEASLRPFLKCVGKEDANYILKEVHEGVCGNHIGARTLAGKTLRQGYYWPTMLKDATELVRKCKSCQEHAKISHLPSEPLMSITSPWPFQQWELEILGPLPIGRGQCKFIIVAVDYFTK